MNGKLPAEFVNGFNQIRSLYDKQTSHVTETTVSDYLNHRFEIHSSQYHFGRTHVFLNPRAKHVKFIRNSCIELPEGIKIKENHRIHMFCGWMYKVDIDYIKLFIMNAYQITKVPIVIHLSKFADEVTSEYVNEMYNDIIEANGHDTVILINERGSVNTKLITNNTLYPYVYIYYSGNHEYVLSNVEKHF